MSIQAKENLLVIAGVILIIAVSGAIMLINNYQTDQYCKTTPLDRIDRDRCGITEDK